LIAALSSCSRSRHEAWIVPENYAGWLRLDYGIKGAPALPLKNGAYVVNVPSNGRLETSTQYRGLVDEDEVFVTTDQGLRKIASSQLKVSRGEPPIQEYAVQQIFGFFTGAIRNAGKCVFVGTEADFKDDGRDCRAWPRGESKPPKITKRERVDASRSPRE
jgi:hypothetical protein